MDIGIILINLIITYSLVFIFIQIVLLVDWAYEWNENWVHREWYKQIVAVSIVIYVGSVVGIILMYVWFAPHCPLNIFFVTFTLLSSALFTYISVREDVERGALLSSAVVTVYCVYLCFSALMGSTDTSCNPFPPDSSGITWILVIGVIIAIASIGWSTIRSASHKTFFDLKSKEEDQKLLSVDEHAEDCYNFSYFHFVFACASMYMAMLMTAWSLTDAEKSMYFDIGPVSMWVKMVSQWITIILYIWSLVGPCIFPNRDWGRETD